MKEIYVHVSNEGTYLTQPIRSIVRADLVSATVARTVPTIVDGDSITLDGRQIKIPTGFYNQLTLINYINSWGTPGISLTREPNTFYTYIRFSEAKTDALRGSSNVMAVLGFVQTVYKTDTLDGKYFVRSTSPGLAEPTQVFLDIEELRHPYMNGFFATFPLDVPTGGIKVFSEASDIKCAVMYPRPLDTIHRLTPHWIDQYRNPLQISGDFLLRLYCKDD
jgi:hypothetical protein